MPFYNKLKFVVFGELCILYVTTTLTFSSTANGQSVNTKATLRSKENIILIYRSFQLITNLFNDAMKDVAMLAAHTGSLIGMTVGMFGTVEFYDKLDFKVYIIFPALAAIFVIFFNVAFRLAPGINDACNDFRRTTMSTIYIYPTVVERKEMKWFLRSCRDIKIWIANFETVEWSTVGDTMNSAADYTFSLLIGVRET